MHLDDKMLGSCFRFQNVNYGIYIEKKYIRGREQKFSQIKYDFLNKYWGIIL